MRLTIFWRAVLAQITLIALMLAMSFYALSQFKRLTSLSTDIVSRDAVCIEEEKRLLRIFLAQMRSAEKYLLLRDKAFYEHFTQGNSDFAHTLEKIVPLVDTLQEHTRLEQIRQLYSRYATGVSTALARNSGWNQEKTEVSDGILTGINELIRLREETIAWKTTAARDQAALATRMVGWLTMGGISIAVVFAYFHARGMSRPLRKLSQELLRVGEGEFRHTPDIRGPKEVGKLTHAFNWMVEKLAELDRMKTDFLAHISHELRTPLTGIREGTALLLEEMPDPITPTQREILEIVRDHSEQLHHSIACVLDLTKMEAGMMEYVRIPSDLISLVEKSVQTIQLAAQKKQIQLEVRCPALLPPLWIDAERIQQVLNNLLSNAVKFTQEGGIITVAASLREDRDGEDRWAEVRVSDTGIGIPAEDMARIFDRFYQSPYHRGQNKRGTGLGLAIARRIIEAHNGQIWVESRVGEGSTFAFALPVHRDRGDKKGLLAQWSTGQAVE
jgi:two-component system sensor histidine kinase GlrK